MIIRFRSKDGMFRVNIADDADFKDALEDISRQAGLKTVESMKVATSPNSNSAEPATRFFGHSPKSLGLKHGDLLFFSYEDSSSNNSEETAQEESNKIQKAPAKAGPVKVKQLPVDDILDSEDGFIPRARSRMCRHGDKGMCEYCSPLPPWDKGYREEHGIKHMSFAAYVKQLNETTNKKSSATSYIAPLTQPDYSVAKHCPSGHAPWPAGICSKCQPSAITLQQQEFRMVDHVEFSSSNIVNEFIEAWRITGCQRFGYLFGTYEKYTSVPLGVKAVVQAIYEPPQHDESDGLTLTLPWEQESEICAIAEQLGLTMVGMIFTDLDDSGKGDGSVVCKRHKDSYFLSSLEVSMAAEMQLRHPNVTKWESSGHFSSKFVTCVISGNTKGDIDIASYQVSASAEALVKSKLIIPSTKPSVAMIAEPSNTLYVPDMFYMNVNEYGILVKQNAKPFLPVEYLLVTLTHGFPDSSSCMFETPGDTIPFPIENRQALGVSADIAHVAKTLGISRSQSASQDELEIIRRSRDFHLLTFLLSLGILSQDEFKLLCGVVRNGDSKPELAYQLLGSPGWQTLITVLRESV